MKWKLPPKIKVYEALGAIGDGRVHVVGNTAKVYSSSGNKYYDVTYDATTQAIMTNDNGSYWQGYLGYPAIAFLCLKKNVVYDEKLSKALAGIHWKDINTQFKNDFDKTEKYIIEKLLTRGWIETAISEEIHSVQKQIEKLELSLLGQKKKPPVGY